MQKYAVYWPEGGASSQYSVFIGQKMSLTGQKMVASEDRNFKASDVSGPSQCRKDNINLFFSYWK
jgi:hypothetical protein